jgi:uncharacterized protein YdhG (YjbR/CyaY superfamily)
VLIAKLCGVELGDPFGSGEDDFDDLAVPDRDGADRERLPVEEVTIPAGAVDERAAHGQVDEEVSMSPEKDAQNSAKGSTARKETSKGFTHEERAAMRERAQELKADARRGSRTSKKKADGEGDVLAKIDAMEEPDRATAKRLHAIIKASAPALSPRTWYGMPAYAKDGNVVCFFQSAQKFKTRYATIGFSDKANLDDGAMWPTAFALKELTPAEEAKVAALVERAVS